LDLCIVRHAVAHERDADRYPKAKSVALVGHEPNRREPALDEEPAAED
jgi:hypothetical protein